MHTCSSKGTYICNISVACPQRCSKPSSIGSVTDLGAALLSSSWEEHKESTHIGLSGVDITVSKAIDRIRGLIEGSLWGGHDWNTMTQEEV